MTISVSLYLCIIDLLHVFLPSPCPLPAFLALTGLVCFPLISSCLCTALHCTVLQVMPSEYDEFILYLEGRRSIEAFLLLPET
jgi:hypothetical protein